MNASGVGGCSSDSSMAGKTSSTSIPSSWLPDSVSATEFIDPNAKNARIAQESSSSRDHAALDEMGEFEDAWEDEIESDEEVVDTESGNHDDGLSGYYFLLP